MKHVANRSGLVMIGVIATACRGAGGDDATAADAAVATSAFHLETPALEIQPGQETTYCYYTSIPTTQTLGVKRWSSTMTPGSHHVTLFFADDSSRPDGTVDQDCGAGVPYWVYAAQTPSAEMVMPDGIGMTVPAGQKIYIQLHYANATDQVIRASARIDADAYDPAETYLPAAAYVTYRAGFSVPARSTASTGGRCAVPPDATFFALTTHTHKLGIHTTVRDGADMIFESTDWEHPGIREWKAQPFFRFSSGHLSYACDYDNPRDVAVREGPSAAANEMCMAIGYYTPATKPTFCFNDTVVR